MSARLAQEAKSIKMSSIAIFMIISCANIAISTSQASYMTPIQQQMPTLAAPFIAPFAFDQNVQENQRSSVLCTISSGDLPITINWLKDGQLLTPNIAQARKIIIKPDTDQSTLKFTSVKLEHAGNYTCVAKNAAGIVSRSAQLIVHGEPRWLREPQHEPIVATRGQTIVIDCQTTGWPKPQQSWQIKNRTQSDFEPLAATGKISLAANGSLVIRNADKADEANYLCKSSNGIGKGISWSTSLKVNVPAHFKSTKQQSHVVRKQNEIQLRCDAFGDEPITIEWFKNKQRLTNDVEPRYSIYNTPIQNGLISALSIKHTQRQDNSIYECVTRNQAGKDRLPMELFVQEEPDNIQELQTTHISSRSVTLVWSEPYDGRSKITGYKFQYKKFNFDDISSASSNVAVAQANGFISSGALVTDTLHYGSATSGSSVLTANQIYSDDWQQASSLTLPVPSVQSSNDDVANNNQVRSITIERLDPSSKYLLRVLAINSIGMSKYSQVLEFTTDDEAPEIGPSNIKAFAINSTSIQVSWDEIPRMKHSARIHGYYIGYRVANSTAQFVHKPFVVNPSQESQQQLQDLLSIQTTQSNHQQQVQQQRLETVINDLRRDTTYEIIVVAFNSRGNGPASDFVLCKTIEMEAPKPVKLSIRRESNESILIEWLRDPLDQNPVDDYILYQEKNSASQDSVSVRLPGNQSQYKASNLKCGTRYQFYIIALNKVGKSAASELISASTSGTLPVIPNKTSLIKLVNSTCLLINLNTFQDNGCRIRTFTVRYRVEKALTPNGSSLVSSNGLIASHAALTSSGGVANGGAPLAGTSSVGNLITAPSEWITIRPKSNVKHQRANEEDRMEYLCDLDPIGEYTIHVAASNDVGRSEIQYTIQMASDELKYSALREITEMISALPNLFAYIPSLIVFLLAGLFLSLVGLILYTTVIKYYQKFVIIQNQIRATRRAKLDEKRRRKLNNMRQQQKQLDCNNWEDQFDEEEGYGDDEEDEDDDSSASSGGAIHHAGTQYANPAGHYISNISNSAFDTSSIDTPCNKYRGGSCGISTTSNDSIHGRFQCLNSKSFVKMNEYTMLPSISSSPINDIYGTTGAKPTNATISANANAVASANNANNSLYYSTLRRSNMQTYLPQQRRQSAQLQSTQSQSQSQQHQSQSQHQYKQSQSPQHQLYQQQRIRSQNVSDIYGYYLPPQSNSSTNNSSPAQQAANEAANSIFVPPQQHPIIYSAPNIRRQPVFL